jgi:16S rRNA processing protein RimM
MSLKDDRYISVGKIGAPFGLDGALKIVSFTEQADDIFDFSPWYVNKREQWVEVELEGEALHGKYLVAKFVGCEERDDAQQWTNCEIAVKRSQLPELPSGQYYWSDLEGLTVKTVAGLTLGVIDEVMETGANPVLIIQGEKRHLVPYLLEKVVKEVNLASNYVIVDWDTDF